MSTCSTTYVSHVKAARQGSTRSCPTRTATKKCKGTSTNNGPRRAPHRRGEGGTRRLRVPSGQTALCKRVRAHARTCMLRAAHCACKVIYNGLIFQTSRSAGHWSKSHFVLTDATCFAMKLVLSLCRTIPASASLSCQMAPSVFMTTKKAIFYSTLKLVHVRSLMRRKQSTQHLLTRRSRHVTK